MVRLAELMAYLPRQHLVMYKELVDKLYINQKLSYEEYLILIKNREQIKDYVAIKAKEVANKHYQNKIYIRGLIEFTNYCKNNMRWEL